MHSVKKSSCSEATILSSQLNLNLKKICRTLVSLRLEKVIIWRQIIKLNTVQMSNFQVGLKKTNNSFLILVIILNRIKLIIRSQLVRYLKEIHVKGYDSVIQWLFIQIKLILERKQANQSTNIVQNQKAILLIVEKWIYHYLLKRKYKIKIQ